MLLAIYPCLLSHDESPELTQGTSPANPECRWSRS